MKRYLLLFLVFIMVFSLFMLSSCAAPQEDRGITNVEKIRPNIVPTPMEIANSKEDPNEQIQQPVFTIVEEDEIEVLARETISIEDFENYEIILIITKLNIEVPIKVAEVIETEEGYSLTDSHDYPQWIPGWSRNIGEKGISVIYGHRQWGIEHRIFSELDKLEPGDEILIIKEDLKFTFIVSESIVITDPNMVWEEINKKEVEVTKKDQSQIALLTCTPWGTNWNRLIVFAIIEEGGLK